ncbi:uncharacterized protein LOC115624789 [Scaptodrosophila lebanonensis]|uniref:Uncharacterized protein LOC115624789 n=1 Tax=Drosophila lebanonensis TaxID=7225 RepID=A0A6J2TKE6_DROLE|nr:uncharacterized protein LOC115624789 [Scaptodrosophila lebanonensis]
MFALTKVPAIVFYIWFIINLTTIKCWLLHQAGLNGSRYNVRHLSTHFSRVFLCLSIEQKNFPTLIEARWPVSYLPMRTVVFPNREMHANGVHSDCKRMHQALWSQVDSLSRLWVMDAGDVSNASCAPKLLVFDLIRENADVLRIDCGQYISTNETQSLVIKMGPKPNSCELERHIYFILGNDPYILSYDIFNQTWYRHQLLSAKYDTVMQPFPITPVDFTFGPQDELYVSDKDGVLFSSVSALKTEGTQVLKTIRLTRIGNFLGPSRSMIMDLGSLFYIVPKFGAVVRCEQGNLFNLSTEGNEIIYLTSKNIQQIFFGAEGLVWVLSDRVLKPTDICYP